MSLSKQLLILISAIFLVIFSVNFVSSVNNIRGYLQIESQIHAQDTATSLGLSISPYIGEDNDPVMETMMNAIFDMGYYREIKLVDTAGKEMVVLTNTQTFQEVPDWFVNWLPMNAAKAETEVSSGWTIGGVLSVEVNPGYGYLKLYEQAKQSFIYSLFTFVGALLLLVLVLRFILLPLRKIESLARRVADGKFDTIKRLPWTTDVKNVAIAMNYMSNKIGNIINKQNKKLESISDKLKKDELTGLRKKNSFNEQLGHLFMAKASGFVLRVNIDRLGDLVKEQGKDKVDQFLMQFAQVLTDIADQNSGISVYRFYGSEFALLVNDSKANEVEALATGLSSKFGELGQQYDRKDLAHIGIAPIQTMSTVHEVLASANEAYEKARLVGNNSFVLNKDLGGARDMAEWKTLVHEIINNRKFRISYVGQAKGLLTGDEQKLVMEEAFTQAFDEQEQPIPIGTFISIAEKFGKIIELDKGVTTGVFQHIKDNSIHYPVIINLSMDSVSSPDFRSWLYKVLTTHQTSCGSVAFSVTAYAAAKDLNALRSFIDFVHRFGAKVLLKRYEAQLITLDKMKDLGLDYIRLARDMTEGIERDQSKRQFLETLQEFAELIDVRLLAENVKDDDDLLFIKKLGIFGASR